MRLFESTPQVSPSSSHQAGARFRDVPETDEFWKRDGSICLASAQASVTSSCISLHLQQSLLLEGTQPNRQTDASGCIVSQFDTTVRRGT